MTTKIFTARIPIEALAKVYMHYRSNDEDFKSQSTLIRAIVEDVARNIPGELPSIDMALEILAPLASQSSNDRRSALSIAKARMAHITPSGAPAITKEMVEAALGQPSTSDE